MAWDTLSCPHRHCRGYGKPCAPGSLVKKGTSRGPPRAWCYACEAHLVLRYGTAYDGFDADPALFETAGRAVAAGHARPRDHAQRRRGQGDGLGLAASGGVPLAPRQVVLLARSACERMPTRRVGELCASQGGTAAWRHELWRPLGGRLGMDRLGPGLAPGVRMRDRPTGSGRCCAAAGPCRACHG